MRCDYCSQYLSGTYLINFWGDKFHENHDKVGAHCKSCTSLIMPNSGSYIMEDGSKICSHCLPEAILDIIQMERCIKAVFQFYKMGDIYFQEDLIEFKLVLDNQLPKKVLGEYTYLDGRYTIKILKGLSKTIFCGVLTHELMHVYLKMLNINILLPEEEGLCEVARYFALKTIGGQLSNAYLHAMEKSEDPIYGYGFKLIRKRIIAMGGSMQKYIEIKTTRNDDQIDRFISKNINDILNSITSKKTISW